MSSDEESIPHLEDEDYSETTTPVPVTALEERLGDENFSGDIGVKGELYLSVDKDEYRAGDLVTGRITVLVSEPLQVGGEFLLMFRVDRDSYLAMKHLCVPLSERKSPSGKKAKIITRDATRSSAIK